MTRENLYQQLYEQYQALINGETDFILKASQLAALLFHEIPGVSWAGFYLHKNNELLLGPFQGKIACMHIALGKGVCGTAAMNQESIVVDDVDQFKGHIACDAQARSEVVIPLVEQQELIGVLDLDSHQLNNFSTVDIKGLEKIVALLIQS